MKSIKDLPPELQIQFIKNLIRETCYDGFKSICSTNEYFRNLCKENISVIKPELNICVLKKRFEKLEFDLKGLDEKMINHIANEMEQSNRINLLQLLSVLKDHNFPFVKGDSTIFINNLAYMPENERTIFVSFLVSLLQNINRFTPFILQISKLPLEYSKKEYLLNLSCNIIGLNKVLETILLNPELNLSEQFLDFFIKNLKFSIDKYVRDIELMINNLREEIAMITDPEDQQLMEEEYASIIRNLEDRMQFLQRYT